MPYLEVMDAEHDSPAVRLRAARKARGFTLEEAAISAEVAKSTWQDWEADALPRAPAAVRAARALGTTVEAIWGDRPLAADAESDVTDDERPTLTPTDDARAA